MLIITPLSKNAVHVLEYTRRMQHFPIYAYILQNPIYKVKRRKVRLDASQSPQYIHTGASKLTNKKKKNTPPPLKKAWQFASTYTDARFSKAWQAEIFSDMNTESPGSSTTTEPDKSPLPQSICRPPRWDPERKSVGIVLSPSARTTCTSHCTMPYSVALSTYYLSLYCTSGSVEHLWNTVPLFTRTLESSMKRKQPNQNVMSMSTKPDPLCIVKDLCWFWGNK